MSTPTLAESAPHLANKGNMTTPTAPEGEFVASPVHSQANAKEEGSTHVDSTIHPLASLGDVRKNVLLFIFAIATFVDICNVSGVAIAVAQIAADTKLEVSQIVWIITSYSLCFAAFLLFAGRLSDVFKAQYIFMIGFIGLGILSLITSFVTTNKYGFLILRGLGGIFGSLTIPSAYHLVVNMFPDPDIQQKKLALLGMAGGIGNVLGLVLAGICMLASYHWFFRLMAIICLAFSIMTVFLLPFGAHVEHYDPTPKWKRLDFVGVLLMMGALITFILALTEGPIEGWNSAAFIAPFVLSFPLAIGFFVWEAKIPPKSAVLPSSVWQITNVLIASLVILVPFPFWATSQLIYSTYFQVAGGKTAILVAALILPQGLITLVSGALTQFFPQIINKARWSIGIGATLMIIAEILQYFSDGGLGVNYWKYCFPAFIIGSFGASITFFASGINLVTFCPPEMAGVAGAWTQVLAQVGGAITLAVQAGFEGNTLEWKSGAGRSFWFMVGWIVVLCGQYFIFYRVPGTSEEEHERARKRILESKGDMGV